VPDTRGSSVCVCWLKYAKKKKIKYLLYTKEENKGGTKDIRHRKQISKCRYKSNHIKNYVECKYHIECKVLLLNTNSTFIKKWWSNWIIKEDPTVCCLWDTPLDSKSQIGLK